MKHKEENFRKTLWDEEEALAGSRFLPEEDPGS